MLEYLTDTSDQYSISVSENGWTDDHLCRDWFVKVFVPHAKERDVHNEGILTIWDGHHSHQTLPLTHPPGEHFIIQPPISPYASYTALGHGYI
jgi:hypothetical protein